MNAAIYARMSTDKQSEASPADQIARCRDFAAKQGWRVAEELIAVDSGISGVSRHNRPALLDLMARIPEWDVLLCWDFSRLARNEEDLGWIRNRLKSAKKTAYEASTGRDIHDIGSRVLGVINAEYLAKLSADTHRGLRGRAERGLATGGPAFGYRTEPILTGQLDSHGHPIAAGYNLVIDEGQAEVVRRIFELYANGEGLRSVARLLNQERVPSPRPRAANSRPSWSPSALQAILRNPIYRGEYVWNRSEWLKDHDTGKRRRFERPRTEWVREDRPDLAIISGEVFERAQAAAASKAPAYLQRACCGVEARVPGRGVQRHLLSGLLSCGECGGSFFAVTGGDRLGCGWHRDRGPQVCGSAFRVARGEVEARVLTAFKEQILVPENVAYVVRRTLEHVEEGLRCGDPERDQARLREIEGERTNLVQLAARTGRIEEVAGQLGALHGEAEQIRERLAQEAGPVDLDSLRPVIERRLDELRDTLCGEMVRARSMLRTLLGGERIRVFADSERKFRLEGGFVIELETRTPRLREATGGLDFQVAGAGNARRTCGLGSSGSACRGPRRLRRIAQERRCRMISTRA